MKTAHWTYSGLTLEGLSLAGIRTSLAIPELSVTFDVAQGFPHAIKMNTFLISHGHMDHASGIPYVISQKAMQSHKSPRFFMPKAMVSPMQEIMKQWTRIEEHDYPFEFIGAKAGDEYPLGSKHFIRVFPTVHGIPSQGYSLYRKFRKLRSDLIDHPSEDILRVRERGEDPTEERSELLVSFTGDTQIEFLDKAPEVAHSKILIMEATYLDERKPISSAKEWGHTHLDELIPRLDSIKSEKIVLIHTSARYTLEEASHIVKRRVPEKDLERIVLFGGR